MLLQLAGAMLIRADSCQFGSDHQKSFVFFGNQRGFETTSLEVQGCMQSRACAGSFYQGVSNLCAKARIWPCTLHLAASDVKVEGLESREPACE